MKAYNKNKNRKNLLLKIKLKLDSSDLNSYTKNGNS